MTRVSLGSMGLYLIKSIILPAQIWRGILLIASYQHSSVLLSWGFCRLLPFSTLATPWTKRLLGIFKDVVYPIDHI